MNAELTKRGCSVDDYMNLLRNLHMNARTVKQQNKSYSFNSYLGSYKTK